MPKVKTLQIIWHGKEPVFSVDFHPDGSLATAGGDKEIKLWEVSAGEDGYATVDHISTLIGHQRTVNCVRFSPNGGHLASAGDCGELHLWIPKDRDDNQPRGNLVSAEEAAAKWRRSSMLCGHGDDVMDVAWSSDGSALLSGAIDNKAIIWDVSGKRPTSMITQLNNHKHFVQGVAWDPMQQFVVTQSADRTCKVYALRPPPASRRQNKISQYLQPACDIAKELYCSHTLSKLPVTVTTTTTQQQQQQAMDAAETNPTAHDPQNNTITKTEHLPLFVDDSISEACFFRRPSWSPDGAFVALAAGTYRTRPGHDVYTAYMFARGQWATPAAQIPGQTKPVVAIRFCPLIYHLPSQPTTDDAPPTTTMASPETTTTSTTKPAPAPFDQLPYKMIFAVATLDSVIIYDTSSTLPLAILGQLHYASITDLAWSSDGQYLAVASRDGYCSVARFDPGELGIPMKANELPPHIAKRMAPVSIVCDPGTAGTGAQKCTGGDDGDRKGGSGAVAVAVVMEPSPCAPRRDINPPSVPANSSLVPPPITTNNNNNAIAAAATPATDVSRKRIVPEMIVPAPLANIDGAGNGDQSQQQQQLKKKKRIVPQAVVPVNQATTTTTTKEECVAAPSVNIDTTMVTASTPAAPATMVEKGGPKRITPTPIGEQQPQAQFEMAKAASSAPQPLEPSAVINSDRQRRITPVPVASSPAAAAVADVPSAVKAAADPGSAKKKKPKVGMSVAAMAALAGKDAALH